MEAKAVRTGEPSKERRVPISQSSWTGYGHLTKLPSVQARATANETIKLSSLSVLNEQLRLEGQLVGALSQHSEVKVLLNTPGGQVSEMTPHVLTALDTLVVSRLVDSTREVTLNIIFSDRAHGIVFHKPAKAETFSLVRGTDVTTSSTGKFTKSSGR